MPWHYVLAASVTPVDAAAGSLVSYILGYGPVGVVVIAFAFRLIVPKGTVDEAVERARADLVAENTRLIEEKREAEEHLRASSERVVPLLESFVSATGTLIPILQGLVRYTLPERPPPDDDRRPRR